MAHNSGASDAVPGDYGAVTCRQPRRHPTGPVQRHVVGRQHLSTVHGRGANQNNLTGSAHETGHGFGYDHSRKLSYWVGDYKDATDVMSAFDGTYEDLVGCQFRRFGAV